MSTHTLLFVVALLALLLALAGLGLGLLAWRKADDLADQAHTHPSPDRRQLDLGPPEGEPERRRIPRHAHPDDTRARRRDADDPRWATLDPTGELPATELPTTAMPAVPPSRATLPPPGSIRG